MRRSSDKKLKQEEMRSSPNREFLLRFLTHNFERETLSQSSISSFNFFLSKQIERIAKSFSTVASEVDACVMLLSSLISNLEEILKDVRVFPVLNDTFYMMMEFTDRCLLAFIAQKSPEQNDWDLVERMLELFEILDKNPRSMSEPSSDQSSDRKLTSLTWVDDLQEIAKCSKTAISEDQKLNNVQQLCLGNHEENYKLVIKSSVYIYLSKHVDKTAASLLALIKLAIVHKRFSTVSKALVLYCRLRVDRRSAGRDILDLFAAMQQLQPRHKSIRQYKQVFEAVAIEKYLSCQQILVVMLGVLKDLQEILQVHPIQGVGSILKTLEKYSLLFTEISQPIKSSQSVFQTIVRVIMISKQKLAIKENDEEVLPESLETLEVICSHLRVFVKNLVINQTTRGSIALPVQQLSLLLLLIQNQTSPVVQQFLFSTLPELVDYLPTIPNQGSDFLLAMHLKLIISFINKNQSRSFVDLFSRYYQPLRDRKVTNFDFAVYFCFLSALDEETIVAHKVTQKITSHCIDRLSSPHLKANKMSLFSDLVLLLNIINKKEYPILKCSVKEFTDHLFSKIDIMSKPLRLPSIVTNQTLLFNPHEYPKLVGDLSTLANLLNQHMDDLTQGHSEIFYYILIEINNLAQSGADSTQVSSEQIDTIKRMRLSNNSSVLSFGCTALEKAIASGNNIEIFHALIRIYSMIENGTDDLHLVGNLETGLLKLLLDMNRADQVSDEEVVEIYNIVGKKGEGNMETFKNFLKHSKDMHVVKFYSQAKDSHTKLHVYIMEIVLRIMIKIYSAERPAMTNNAQLQKIHLFYLPMESPYLLKQLTQSQLQLVYISMYLVSRDSVDASITKPMKSYLLKEFAQVARFFDKAEQSVTSIVKFKELDFAEYLLGKFLAEYETSRKQDVPAEEFIYQMLDLLVSQPAALNHILAKIQNSNFIEEKVPLVFSRVKYLVSHQQPSTEVSSNIYHFLEVVNKDNHLFSLNLYAEPICKLDPLKDYKVSILICRELTLLKHSFTPDEDLVTIIFQYIAKMYEFYQGFTGFNTGESLLSVVPQMVCEVFRINSKVDSEVSVSALNNLQKLDKSGVCARLANNSQSTYYRCMDCDQKRNVCYNCLINCHEGHTYFSLPAKSSCQCATSATSNCKFKKPHAANPNQAKKSSIRQIPRQFLPDHRELSRQMRETKQLREGVREIRQISEMKDHYRASQPMYYGRQTNLHQPFNPQSYLHAYEHELLDHSFNNRQLMRYERAGGRHQIRDFAGTFVDEESSLEASPDYEMLKLMEFNRRIKRENYLPVSNIPEGRQRLDRPQRPDKQEVEEEEVEEPTLSDQYQDKVMVPEEQTICQRNIISNQSYLLHIFLSIVQQKFVKGKRKTSVHQTEAWKLPSTVPTVTKFTQNSTKVFGVNYKAKLNIDNSRMNLSSPMIVRKPIAIMGKLVLLLSSMAIYVFEAKKFLSHLINPSNNQPQHVYRHDLTIEAHSIQFVPWNPRQLCVCGVWVMQILNVNVNENTITKNPASSFQNPSKEIINKIQCLEIGILVGDAKSIKLIEIGSKNVLLLIPGPKQEGTIREWSALKEVNPQTQSTTYSLLAITSYGSVFQLRFDQNDRGEKKLTKLNNYTKRKDEVGVSMYQATLFDGRRIMLAGVKDSQTNLAGIIENDSLLSSTTLQFNSVFGNCTLLGHVELVESTPERILFACTLKDTTNREMSIHSGLLTLVALTSNQKFQVQHLQYHPDMLKCEGFFVWKLDKETRLILSMAQDGSLYVHNLGPIRRESINRHIQKLNEQLVQKEEDTNTQEIRKVISTKLSSLALITKVKLNPIVQFMEKSELLKRGSEYTYQKGGSLVSVNQMNSDKIITGISLRRSFKVVLATRTIDNALEVGFSHLQCVYFYVNGLKFNLEKPSKEISRPELFDKDDPLAYSQRIEFIPFQLKKDRNTEFQLYGQSAVGPNSKLRKIQTLIKQLDARNNIVHTVEIFKVLQILLQDIRKTQNYIIEDFELKAVIDSLKDLLVPLNEEYYSELRRVIVCCLQVYNRMTGQPDPRADGELNPYTLCAEITISELESLGTSQVALFVDDLHQLAYTQPQVFFFLITKHHKLPQRLHNKFSRVLSLGTTKNKHKPDVTVDIDLPIQKLLGIFVASLNLRVAPAQRDQLLFLVKSIFSKYSGSKTIRELLHDKICMFFGKTPEDWIQKQVKSVEAQQPTERVESNLREDWKTNLQESYMNEDMMMHMDVDAQMKYLEMLQKKQLQLLHNKFIEEEKMDFEEEAEMEEMLQCQPQSPTIDNRDMATDIFLYCMRPFENEDSYETAYDHLLMAYTCFKATETVNASSVDAYLKYILKSLNNLSLEKVLPAITIAYFALFAKIVTKSRFLSNNRSEIYEDIKQTVLSLVDRYLQRNAKWTSHVVISFSHVLRLKPISPEKVSLPHVLLSLLRGPIEPTPSILYLKFYSLLPNSEQFYKAERDRAIYQKSMSGGDIQNVYRKAKKNLQNWKTFANIQWLEEFIGQKKPGWPLALQLLSLYYEE